DRDVALALLEAVCRRRRFAGTAGKLMGTPAPGCRELLEEPGSMEPYVLSAEQSNTSIVYGDRVIFKLVRRLEPGVNPDLEIGRFLTEAGFPHIPPVAGALEYRGLSGDSMTLGIVQGF